MCLYADVKQCEHVANESKVLLSVLDQQGKDHHNDGHCSKLTES